MQVPRLIRNSIISVVVIISVLLAGGVAYTLLAGDGVTESPAVQTKSAATPSPHMIKPTPPATNAPEGVAVETLTSPIKAGANAMLIVKTNPGSACTISVIYNNVASKDSGLAPKIADAYGGVSWTWTVEAGVPPGNWPIKVNCSYHGKSAVVQADLQVTK